MRVENNIDWLHQPLPRLQASGVPWLGDMPTHWDVQRLKEAAMIVAGQSPPSEIVSEYLDASPFLQGNAEFGRIHPSPRLACETPPKSARLGDILLSVRAPVGALNVADRDYGIGRGLCAVRVRPGLYGHFIHYALGVANPELRRLSTGSTYDAVTAGVVGGLGIPLPPLPEQHAIVRYLDHADRRIRRYVSAKRKLIALLEEERKKATYEAIQSLDTRSYRLEIVANLAARPIERAGGETYTPIGLYNRGRGIFKKEPRSGNELGDSSFFWVEEGDLVISGQFAWEGAIALASDVEHGCVASHRFPILRGKRGISDSGFLLSFFQTAWGQLLLDHHSRGAAGRNRPLNIRTLLKEAISLPPLESQLRVSEMLQRESYVRQQVRLSEQLLTEYRTRLIADVVTGKLDVRGAAAQLPEEDDEAEPIAESVLQIHGLDDDLYDADNLEEESAIESEVTV